MTDFEKWKGRYDKNWATKTQLQTLVRIEVLSEEEYKEITGEEYSA